MRNAILMWFVFPLAVFTTDESFRKAAGTQRRDRERRCISYPLRNFVQPAGAGFFHAIDMHRLTLPLQSHAARILRESNAVRRFQKLKDRSSID